MITIKYKWKYLASNDEIYDRGIDGQRVWLNSSFDTPEEANVALAEYLGKVYYFNEELILVTEAYSNHLT